MPTRLDHRIEVAVGSNGHPATVIGAPTTVDRRKPLRVSPPLRGANLAVFGCCGPPFLHRRAALDLDGQRYLAQRYAIDFVRLDEGVNRHAGDPARNESYFIYGAPVMAVAPGQVLTVRDGVPENTPTVGPPDLGTDDVLGNVVLQELGGGRTAAYAHLRTGSVQVRPGDWLDRGQVLGHVGNTGMSFEPHLHLQVTDRPGLPSGLAADGAPLVFDRFWLHGHHTGFDTFPPAPVRTPVPPPNRRSGQYPLTGDIVAFHPGGNQS